jgi:signal transduction histidine kinase
MYGLIPCALACRMTVAAELADRWRPPVWIGLDVGLALVLTVGALADVRALDPGAPVVPAVLLCVLCTSTVAWRRSAPVAAVTVAATALWVYELGTYDQRLTFAPYAVLFDFYMLGRRTGPERRLATLAGMTAYGLVALGITNFAFGGAWVANTAGVWPLYVGLPCAIGALVARYHLMNDQLAANTARLSNDQELRAASAAAQERTRIARELHDVIAHCVSVMVIQASAARLVAASDVAMARNALRVVESCGRETMGDLRRIMGVLHRQRDDPGLTAPGLAQLGALAERTRRAGLPITVRVHGPLRPLPADVDLVAYRVIQEALTNVVKHAASPAEVTVELRADTGTLELSVSNSGDGSLPREPSLGGAGQGLVGMRERVRLFGGHLRTGPTPGGGYEVRARIPLLGVAAVEPAPAPQMAEIAADSRPRAWLDVLLACGWLVALETEVLTSSNATGPLALNLVVVALMALAGLARRRAPVAFLLATGLLAIPLRHGLTSGATGGTLTGFYGILVPTYAVGAWAKRSHAIAGFATWAVCATVLGVAGHSALSGVAGPLLAAGAAFSVGILVRSQRDLAARLTESSRRLAAEDEDRARLAVVAERTRIARDLHALVARGVTVMIIQAEAAQDLLGSDPPRALVSITAIEAAGREALAQMRRLLGVLRSHEEGRTLEPLPGLDHLHALVGRARADGTPVELTVEGEPGMVFAGIDMVTYRILEEALAMQPRRSTSPITVVIRFGEDFLQLELSTKGTRAQQWPTPAMRERVAICAGELVVEPGPDHASRMFIQLPRHMEAVLP